MVQVHVEPVLGEPPTTVTGRRAFGGDGEPLGFQVRAGGRVPVGGVAHDLRLVLITGEPGCGATCSGGWTGGTPPVPPAPAESAESTELRSSPPLATGEFTGESTREPAGPWPGTSAATTESGTAPGRPSVCPLETETPGSSGGAV